MVAPRAALLRSTAGVIGEGGETGQAPTRVLHVVPYFPPDRVGGVGEVVAHLHASLLDRGVDSRVLTSGRSRDEARVVRTGRTPDGFVLASPTKVALARWADIVHVHHGEAIGLLTAMKVLGSSTPVLLTLHASPGLIGRSLGSYRVGERRISAEPGLIRRTLGTRLRQAMDRASIIAADHTSYISRSTARDYLGDDAAGRATIIYNGLPERSNPVEDNSPQPRPVDLLYVGSYSVRKRVQVLPAVLARVRDSVPGARLRVIGFDPVQRSEFLELARAHGVHDAIDSPGVLRSGEIAAYYRAAKVLLVPSAYEGLPMVIMEAMQNGLPCVATRVSGHPEIIEEGRSGFLTPLDDVEAMADAAVRIIRDPGLARRMGEAGQATVRDRFGLGRQVEGYLEVYRALTEPAKR